MASRPKTPKPTKEEVALQNRQREESSRLDDEENTRFKRILSGQLGNRRLLSSSRRKGATTLSATAGGGGGGSGAAGGAASAGAGGGRASAGRMTVSKGLTSRGSLA